MIAPTMSDLLTAFQTHLASDGCAARTIETYAKITTAFIRTLSGRPPVRADVEVFLARSRLDGATRAPAGRNQELAALRSLASHAVEGKRWLEDPTRGVKFTRKARRDPAFLDEDELHQLFRAAHEQPPAGEKAQILAIVALLSQRGLRIRELVELNVSQLDLARRTLLRVRGKGGTRTDLRLNVQAVTLLAAWLRERECRAPPGEEALFVSSRRSRLAVRTVENWFVTLRSPMGTAKKMTPHTMRHSFAMNQLLDGADIRTVAGNMRHADVGSTLGYLHLVDKRQAVAIDRLGKTVPQDVLEAVAAVSAANTPSPTPANEPVPVATESPASPRTEPLDDQYRLVAI